MGAVLSTDFNPNFMPATVNTIILKHWDDIFSKTLFNWEVVLNNPNCIKLRCCFNSSCFLCKPYKKNSLDEYKPIHLDLRGKSKPYFANKQHMSLMDAIRFCEKFICKNGHHYFNTELNLSYGEPYSSNNLQPNYLTPNLLRDWVHLPQYLSEAPDVLPELKSLGLSSDALHYIERLNSYYYAVHVLNKLKYDVLPTKEDFESISSLYCNFDILSKEDIEMIKKNKPIVNHTCSTQRELTFGLYNWNCLSPQEQIRRKNEARKLLTGHSS